MRDAVKVMAELLVGVDLDSHIAVFAALYNAGVPPEDIAAHMDEAMELAGKALDRAHAALGI